MGDTNVLMYAASTTPEEADKRSIARAILKRDDLVLSAQVLQEFYVQATRATKPDRLPHQRAVVEAARLAGCPTVYTEDLQDGMSFAGVVVEDPFAAPA